jgi:DNA-directed RNA polymerase subunit RPC12/RpoP
VRLKELCLNSRGVEIGKKGKVIQCYHCGVWMPPMQWKLEKKSAKRYNTCRVCKNKLFFEKMKKKDSIILDDGFSSKKIKSSNILLGENVNKYYTRGQKVIKLGYRGIKYKSEQMYKEKKIVLRKTSDSIAATVDYQGRHTIQVVYQFSLKEDYKKYPFLLEYILGIITSKIMYFFYSKKHVYNNRKNFPHHIQSNILNLPIPSVKFEEKTSLNYRLHIKIAFCSMLLMFLNQTSKTHVIDRQLIKQFREFIKINQNLIESEGFFPLIDEKIKTGFRKLLEKPKHINISQDKIEFFEGKLNEFVENMFGVN